MPVASKWKLIGIHLGFKQEEIDKINADVTGMDSRTGHCFPKVLRAWLEGEGSPVQKAVLVQAVKNINYGSLARKIENQGTYV